MMNHKYSSLTQFLAIGLRVPIKNRLGICQSWVKLVCLILLASCSHLFYQPLRGALIAPERFGVTPEEVWLEASDGVKLHAWVVRAKNPHSTLLLFHGNAENMSTHFLNLLWVVEQGVDLLIFDYRGYGMSEGVPTQAGVYLDALAAMRWAQLDHLRRETDHLIFYGQSLGGQVLGRAVVDFEFKEDVDLLVFDSTFKSYKDVASRKFLSRWWLTPFYPLARVLISDEYASRDVLQKIKTPSLVLHSPHDPVVDFQGGRELYQSLSAPKWWWKIQEGQHADAFHVSDGKYRKKFLELITRKLAVKSSH